MHLEVRQVYEIHLKQNAQNIGTLITAQSSSFWKGQASVVLVVSGGETLDSSHGGGNPSSVALMSD